MLCVKFYRDSGDVFLGSLAQLKNAQHSMHRLVGVGAFSDSFLASSFFPAPKQSPRPRTVHERKLLAAGTGKNMNIKLQSKQHSGLRWIILCSFGWATFIPIVVIIGWLAWQIIQNSTTGHDLFLSKSGNVLITSITGGLCWGAIVGGLQHSFLRHYFNSHGMKWIFATILGFTLYLAIQVLHQYLVLLPKYPFYPPFIMNLFKIVFYFAPPLVLGIAQWLAIRPHFKWSGWWIIATTLGVGSAGWGISEIAGLGAANIVASNSIVVNLTEGLAYGIATWIVLAVFSKQLTFIDERNIQ